jgi:hypothetical protein
MADSGFLLKRKSIFICLGSFEAGLTYQLSRVLLHEHSQFRPIPTYTTSTDSDLDTVWFHHVTYRQCRERVDTMNTFTFYQIGSGLYYVMREDARRAIEHGHSALIGMPRDGYERFLSSTEERAKEADRESESLRHAMRDKGVTLEYYSGIGMVSHSVIGMGPADVTRFAQALVRERGWPYERALECARQAQIASTIPPKSSGTFRLNLHLEGPKDEQALGRLASFLKTRSS